MYRWDTISPLELCGVKVPRGKSEVYIQCPYCGSKRFAYNTDKGIGKCFSCEKAADSAKYYAVATGQSLDEARRDIETRLGLVDEKGKATTLPPRIVYKPEEKKEAQRASDEVCDKTYRTFLSMLTLSEKNRYMLLARGLSDSEIIVLDYKTFPGMSEVNYFGICKSLIAEGCTLEGVPGFYKHNGSWTFVQLTKGIIMPQKNSLDQIVGLQIRKDDDLRVWNEEMGEYEAKCAWFSSKNREGGCGANANVHYACDFKFDRSEKTWHPVFKDGFVLTEGIMKADIVHHLRPNLPVIAVPGVHALKGLEKELRALKNFGVESIVLCYDMDYKTNPNVQAALKKTEELIKSIGLRCKPLDWETKVDINGEEIDLLKGIDDYLAFCEKGIVPQIKEKSQAI